MTTPAKSKTNDRRHRDVDWYRLPEYYDIVFEEGTLREADFLEGVAERFGRREAGRRVLEPACGSGRLLLELARRGWDATGFDASPDMLAYAARRCREASVDVRLDEGRMESFVYDDVPGFDLAFCLVSTFKYLVDPAHVRGHFRCMADALVDDGLYVLGLHLSEYENRSRSRERWVSERDGTRVVSVLQGWPADRDTRTEQCRIRLSVEHEDAPSGSEPARYEHHFEFRTYDTAELQAALAEVPELEHVATFDFDYDLAAPRELDDEQLDAILILRRRKRS